MDVYKRERIKLVNLTHSNKLPTHLTKSTVLFLVSVCYSIACGALVLPIEKRKILKKYRKIINQLAYLNVEINEKYIILGRNFECTKKLIKLLLDLLDRKITKHDFKIRCYS